MPNRAKLLAAALITPASLLAGTAAAASAHTANVSKCSPRHAAHHPPRACHSRVQPHRLQPHRLQPRHAQSPATPTPHPRSRRVAAFSHGKAPSHAAAPASEEEAPAANAAATIAQVLSTPCQNTEITPAEANLELVKAAVMCLINRERAQNGVPPLQPNAQLEAAATGHSRELVADDYFAHVSPSGETPVDRIRATGYIPDPQVGYVIGENLAWGTYSLATPQAIVQAWIASPGHLANILEVHYRDTGIGVTPAVPESLGGGSPGATYAEEFGVIQR